jgi:hypothetical protein
MAVDVYHHELVQYHQYLGRTANTTGPKVTHAKNRTSHAGCNACDALSGAFYIAFVTRMSRIMCTKSARDARGMLLRQHVTRVGCALLTRVSSIHVLQMSRTSSA